MKKHEASSSMRSWLRQLEAPQCFRVVEMRVVLSVMLVVALPAFGQDFSAPPLVEADTVDPAQGQVLRPPAINNAPLNPNAQPQPLPTRVPGTLQPQAPQPPPSGVQNPYGNAQQEPYANPYANPSASPQAQQPPPGTVQQQTPPTVNPRLFRIGMSALFGAGFGTATAIAGGFLGGEFLRPGLTVIGNIWTGGAIGFAIGAPIGVLVSGLLFKGDAPWWAPILGDLIGVAAGIGTVAIGGPNALSTTFIFPLLGSIIGYEVGSRDDATVAPTVTVLPQGQGAVAGVQGRW